MSQKPGIMYKNPAKQRQHWNCIKKQKTYICQSWQTMKRYYKYFIFLKIKLNYKKQMCIHLKVVWKETSTRQYMTHTKSLVWTMDCNQIWMACIFHALGFWTEKICKRDFHAKQTEWKKNWEKSHFTPYRMYNEYADDNAVPNKDNREALLERFLDPIGRIPSNVTIKICQNPNRCCK